MKYPLIIGLSVCLIGAVTAIIVINQKKQPVELDMVNTESAYVEEDTKTFSETEYVEGFIHSDEDEEETILIDPQSGLITDSEDDGVAVSADKITEEVEGIDYTEAEDTLSNSSSGGSSSSHIGPSVENRLSEAEESTFETTNNENALPIDIRETQE